MKKLLSNRIFALIFSLAVVLASSFISVDMKTRHLPAETILQYMQSFPGSFLIR